MDLVETTPLLALGPVADDAQRIAFQAHQGQQDKIGHATRVAARLDAADWPDEVVAAGSLHDLLEDTDWTANCLRAAGMPEETVRLVQAMTRLLGQSADDYYAGLVAAGPAAIAIKVADLDDNTDPDRMSLLEAAVRDRLARKYAKARRLLGVIPAQRR
jgi:hypothetical protein